MSNPIDFHLDADDPLFRADAPPVIAMVPADGTSAVTTTRVAVGGVMTPMTQVQGVSIGEVEGTIIRVFVAQLRLEPDVDDPQQAKDMARRGYDQSADKKFATLTESVRRWGSNIEPLICEPTGEIAQIDGQDRPLLWVRAGLRRYCALVEAKLPYALVQVLPRDAGAKERALLALVKNETQEPLPILDRCDLVYDLVERYGMKEDLIAFYIGMTQSHVSRLYIAARQPPLIRTYLSNNSLTLDAVGQLNAAFAEIAGRELAARSIVLEGLKGQKLASFLTEVAPPKAVGVSPTVVLVLHGEGEEQRVIKQPTGKRQALPPASEKPRPSPRTDPLPYWKRDVPLAASPVTLLNRHHEVRVSGTPAEPLVEVADLSSLHLLHELEQDHTDQVALRRLEEAMLSDLEAIRAALEAQGTPVQQPVQKVTVVESTARLVS